MTPPAPRPRPRRVIRWRAQDIPCVDCAKPARYGWTAWQRAMTRCCMCETARALAGWRYRG